MAGNAVELGQSAAIGALTGILGALTGGQTEPERRPTPTAPSIARPALILGLPVATVAIIGLGIFLVMRLSK